MDIAGSSVLNFSGGAGTAEIRNAQVNGTIQFKLATNLTLELKDSGGTRQIGFFGTTPAARGSGFVQNYSTADRTLNAYTADDESAAYVGIDNMQPLTPYATVSDLNAIRVAYENLRAFTEDLAKFTNSLVDELQLLRTHRLTARRNTWQRPRMKCSQVRLAPARPTSTRRSRTSTTGSRRSRGSRTRRRTSSELKVADWKKVIDLNITGTFQLTQRIGKEMSQQRSGKIINIVSYAGLIGTDPEYLNAIAYNTSKGGLIAFTKDLAVKWSVYGIQVNAISPGWFLTEMTKWSTEHHGKKMVDRLLVKRFGRRR